MKRRRVFEDFPINEVASIQVIEKDKKVTLNRGAKQWEVAERDGFPANKTKIVEMLQAVWDLGIGQPVPLAKNQFGRVKLLDPEAEETEQKEAATVLKLSGAGGKDLGSIWLGKVHETSEGRPNPFGGGMMMNDAGRYVKRGDSNAVFIVEETFRDAQADPSEWLDDSFFEVSKIKSISRKTKKPEDDWVLSREEITGDFELPGLKENEEVDATKASSMKSAFSSSMRFEDVLVGEEAKKPDFSVFTIETFDGFTYKIAASEKSDTNDLTLTVDVSGKFEEKRKEGEEESDEEKKRLDQEFAAELKKKKEKLAKEKLLAGRVFKVRGFMVDSLTKARSELIKEKEKQEAVAPKGDATKGKGKAVPKGKAASKGEASKGKAAKGDAPKGKAAPKGDPSKGEAPKGKGNAPKGKTAPKGEAPKGEASKGEAAKGEAPKGEAAKGEAAKGEAAKGSN